MNYIGAVLIVLILIISLVLCNRDIPCNKVKTENGYICVCNSTYCDTISRPEKLPLGQFHFYYTSDEKPGFNHETGTFRMQSFSPYGFKYFVNTSKTAQTIRGFGGAFSDSFGFVFNSLSFDAQENLLQSVFSKDGIEYTVCRVVIGSSDFSLRTYTYAPDYDPSLKSFSLTEDDYLYKISVMKRAMNKTTNKINFFGSSWATPSWMKIDNCTKNGFLNPRYRQVWADYYVKTLDAFKKEGIEFWALTTGNEPITLIMVKNAIDTLLMFPEEQREWIVNNLGPALRNANYSTKIISLDDMRLYSVWFTSVIMRDPRAKDYVIGPGLHWYFDHFFDSTIFLDLFHKYFPDQEIIYTESSINVVINHTIPVKNRKSEGDITVEDPVSGEAEPVGVKPLLGSWDRATLYAVNILENLNHFVTTYTDWNIGLDLEGGPHLGGLTCDASIIVNATADEFYKQPIHYVLGHFSKFMNPGSIIIGVESDYKNDFYLNSFEVKEDSASETRGFYPPTIPPPSQDIKYAGVKNPDGSLAIIFHNPKSVHAEIRVHDPNRGYAFVNLEPRSVSTIVYC